MKRRGLRLIGGLLAAALVVGAGWGVYAFWPRPADGPSWATEYDLAPGVLCPNGTLEAIARLQPHSTEELARIGELRRWQLRELGEELLRAVAEPAPAT